ncbi:MAG TPA: rhodanese-like domain-containing protein [Flavisolibacter sp.]|nr:rhodanese-like domain-containing protein [Flavisolibacter sp.]
MKHFKIKHIAISLFALFIFQITRAQNPENWTSKQLLEPSVLAENLNSGKEVPIIISVGPGAVIPNSINIGMAKESGNIQKLKNKLKGLPKNTRVVIYCGCCPFDHCPNVRPAIDVLKEMKFTNYQLLDLPHNIKTDWIDKGYPQIK